MKTSTVILLFLSYCKIYTCQESCTIDVDCEDCLPENLPAIVSHVAFNKQITVVHGEQVIFHCHNSKFKTYPDRNYIIAHCDNSYYKVQHDTSIVHLNELGCQVNYIEDVLHHVDHCNSTYQGRSYQYHNSITSIVHHLAEVCYDPEKGRTMFARMSFSKHNDIVKDDHTDKLNKINMLESFNQMFDSSNKIESEKVYADDVVMNKRLQSLLGKRWFNFAEQTLVATKLLPAKFYHDQNGIITNFPFNKVAAWKSIANGNLRHMHNDIFNAFYNNERNASIDLYVGTHGTMTLFVEQRSTELFLKPGRKFPVPKYIYTIIHDKLQNKALALILVNNPFISISEIRSNVFCPSVCPLITWLNHLRMNSNYERSVYGLVFCCDLFSFSNIAVESPNVLPYVNAGERGLLKDGFN